MTSTGQARVSGIQQALLEFYDDHARDLPWRRTRDPYRIWVSEIMLQQTRVDTVRDYYARWMERFPDVAALADADLEDVLGQWKGLGYYARARNLHRAAGVVKERHGGRLPADPAKLRALPGVGRYTAGAVGSIAFSRVEPAVDGNVKRVLSRLFDLPDPTERDLYELAARLVDPNRPGDFNQALMELGATVCTPRNPGCDRCPLYDACLALARGTVGERPKVKPTKPVPHVHLLTAVAVLPGGRTLLRRRPENGLLGGLWEFPAVELEAPPAVSPAVAPAVSVAPAATVSPKAGVSPAPNVAPARTPPSAASGPSTVGAPSPDHLRPELLEPVDHRFSHLRATYHPFLTRLASASGVEFQEGGGHDVRAAASVLSTLEVPAALAVDLAVNQRTIQLGPGPIRTPTFSELHALPMPVAQTRIAAQAVALLAE